VPEVVPGGPGVAHYDAQVPLDLEDAGVTTLQDKQQRNHRNTENTESQKHRNPAKEAALQGPSDIQGVFNKQL